MLNIFTYTNICTEYTYTFIYIYIYIYIYICVCVCVYVYVCIPCIGAWTLIAQYKWINSWLLLYFDDLHWMESAIFK